mmetsp:Transcript_40055/g.94980  ORF Transcript_40055/g.94980 Transcript_40055/m.94980 type:complete len:306 (+) Transcript_40055:81-998(+)
MSADVSATWLPSLLAGQPGEKPAEDLSGKYGATGSTPGGSPTPEKDSILQQWSKIWFAKLPKTVDTCLSALGLSLTLITMLFTETWSGFRLYSLSMSASGIVFFAPPTPPQFQGFLLGTAVGLTISWGLFTVLPFEIALGLAAGIVMLFYKSFNVIFPSCAALGVLIAQEMNVKPGGDHSVLNLDDWRSSATYVLSPWLAGHLVLFFSAYLLSYIRKEVRRYMMRGQLLSLGTKGSREELITIFNKYDTSGDGFLDADELRIALRAVGGADVSIEDCEEMIGSIDADGDGVISCEEFIELQNQLQ